MRRVRPVSVSTSATSSSGPRTTASRPPGTKRMPATSPRSGTTASVRLRPGRAMSTTLIVPSAWPTASRRPSALSAARRPVRAAGLDRPSQPPRPRQVPDEDRSVEPCREERPAVRADLQRRDPVGVSVQRLGRRAGADVPHDRVTVVARGDQRATVRREARRGDRAAMAPRRAAHGAAAEIDEANGAVLPHRGRRCGRRG